MQPEPYGKIQYKNSGTIIGKHIHINNTKKAISIRLAKAKQLRYNDRSKLFLNKTLYTKTKILLRNALVRSTMTYSLHTHENNTSDIAKWNNSPLNV